MYIKQIEIVDNSYPSNVLPKNFKINCSSINLLVGEQGCGKSTLLKLLQENHKDIKITFFDLNFIQNVGVDTFYFDSEKDNPRIKDPELYTKFNGEDIGIGFCNAVMTRFKSHGEVLQNFIIEPLKKAKDCVIFLDEPESGLSITNQFKLIKEIKKASKRNVQLFIATHCYPLIESFDVISLQHLEQMTGKEFIKRIKK